MLTISDPIKATGPQVDYYLELAREDYYLEGGEPPGVWAGQGSEALGLDGKVDKEAFRHLLRGLAADGETPLVKNAGSSDRQAAWDLTFSAPKSVSVVWSQADRELRGKIQDAQLSAVKQALSYLEEEVCFTRRGHGGKHLERAYLIVALFEHGTSRLQDPQLHTHALLLNLTVRQDGTTGTLRSKEAFDYKMAAGAIYRVALAHELQKLGFGTERDNEFFRIKGVPEELCETFSKRRQEIVAELERRGKTDAITARNVTLQTRQIKEHIARDDLFSDWHEVGDAFHFGASEVQRLKSASKSVHRPDREDYAIAVDARLETEKPRTKPERVQVYAEEAQGRLSVDELLKELKTPRPAGETKKQEEVKTPSPEIRTDEAKEKNQAPEKPATPKREEPKKDPASEKGAPPEESPKNGAFGLHVKTHTLFPKAPLPALRKIKIPYLSVSKIKPKPKYGKTLAIIDGPLGKKLAVREKLLFPNAPIRRLKKMKVPVLQVWGKTKDKEFQAKDKITFTKNLKTLGVSKGMNAEVLEVYTHFIVAGFEDGTRLRIPEVHYERVKITEEAKVVRERQEARRQKVREEREKRDEALRRQKEEAERRRREQEQQRTRHSQSQSR